MMLRQIGTETELLTYIDSILSSYPITNSKRQQFVYIHHMLLCNPPATFFPLQQLLRVLTSLLLLTMIQGVIKIGIDQLNLPMTLATGQNFRWRKKPDTDQWIGVLANRIVVRLVQHPSEIEYHVLNNEQVLKKESSDSIDEQKNVEKLLQDYFRLEYDIDDLYKKWSACDDNFAKVGSTYRGIRLLRQEVVENIFSFICSSNNNISRISKMIETLCTNYGTKLHSFTDCDLPDIHSFPSIEELAKDHIENDLRQLSFGYRSRFISDSAKQIVAASQGNSDDWLTRLGKLTYEDAKQELMSLPGIGAKVADCICLMSLSHTEAIPVDTHVYQITAKNYLPHLQKVKSLTPSRYNEIGHFYRETFQEHAGWAQTVLFAAHLKQSK